MPGLDCAYDDDPGTPCAPTGDLVQTRRFERQARLPGMTDLVPLTAAVRPCGSDELAQALIHGRHTVLPRRLGLPGPDAAQTERILGAAASAPDHHTLLPWRFILVPARPREEGYSHGRLLFSGVRAYRVLVDLRRRAGYRSEA